MPTLQSTALNRPEVERRWILISSVENALSASSRTEAHTKSTAVSPAHAHTHVETTRNGVCSNTIAETIFVTVTATHFPPPSTIVPTRTESQANIVQSSSSNLAASSSSPLHAFTTTTADAHLLRPPRRSTYPRPSPPTFLYPDPIVPRAAVAMSTDCSTGVDGCLPDYLPNGFIYFLYILIALGFAWATVVYYGSVREQKLTRTRRSRPRKVKRRRKDEDEKRWEWFSLSSCLPNALRFGRLGTRDKKEKPIDKPSKYALLATKDDDSECESGISTASTTEESPFVRHLYGPNGSGYIRFNNSAIELRSCSNTDAHSPRGTRSRPHQRTVSESTDEWIVMDSHTTNTAAPPVILPNAELNQNNPSPSKHLHPNDRLSPTIPGLHSSSRSSSPENPYLPTLHKRTISESSWLTSRAAFEAQTRSPSPSPTHSNTPSMSYSSYFDRSTIDIEAQDPLFTSEQQNGSQKHSRSGSLFGYLSLNSGSKETDYTHGGAKGTGTWLDVVDGAVTKAVDKVVKWTEDGGGDEGLLLPVAASG